MLCIGLSFWKKSVYFWIQVELGIQYKWNQHCLFSVKISVYYLSFTLQPYQQLDVVCCMLVLGCCLNFVLLWKTLFINMFFLKDPYGFFCLLNFLIYLELPKWDLVMKYFRAIKRKMLRWKYEMTSMRLFRCHILLYVFICPRRKNAKYWSLCWYFSVIS